MERRGTGGSKWEEGNGNGQEREGRIGTDRKGQVEDCNGLKGKGVTERIGEDQNKQEIVGDNKIGE